MNESLREPIRPGSESSGMPPITRGDYDDLVWDNGVQELERDMEDHAQRVNMCNEELEGLQREIDRHGGGVGEQDEARRPKVASAPFQPTSKEREEHEITHLPHQA